MTRRWPDFFIVGAPKAGTTALHAALSRHPRLALSGVKEPKYFLCGDAPPPLYLGPGDAHSRREWIWQRDHYLALFADAPADVLVGESTPLYLDDPAALLRIHDVKADAKLIAVVRDPVDRAYSNWMHLWSDGLEPEADFVTAVAMEDARRRRGWAPFWRYRSLGLYGKQLQHARTLFSPEQIHVLRYRDLVETPDATLASVCDFLGVSPGPAPEIPRDNVKPFVPDTLRSRTIARAVRTGARLGALGPPEIWRAVEQRMLAALQSRGERRPSLNPEQRRQVQGYFLDDLSLLERLTGYDLSDWRGESGQGDFESRALKAS
jgi:hypothetical protein